MMPLSMVAAGKKVKLLTVNAGRGLKARLANMGLVPGVELEVISNSRRGPFIVAMKETRLLLGRGMAHKIEVE
ncbi:MAG: FeoA family protein [candidate division Zixibacteria bacterium]|nr:FeoA family protein [candidate division Zixibacteria bacterium]